MTLQVEEVSYNIGQQEILKAVSLDVANGEAVAIVGESGSGKSTLLGVLSGLIQPLSGSIWLDGENLTTMSLSQRDRHRLSNFGFVMQSGELLPELNAIENVALPLKLLGRGDADQAARLLLVALGIAELEDRSIDHMSGGQSQRVAVARALVHRPKAILADEPTGSLDSSNGEVVLRLLLEASKQQGASLVLVTHSMSIAAQCDRVLSLSNGCLV